MTAHERAEMDPVEVMRGKKTKMAGASYLKHFSEYFVFIAPNQAKEGKADIMGNKFEDENATDLFDNPDILAGKIKVQMKESSVGIKGRVGEFTLHRNLGIINIHEEVFRLGVARGVIQKPTLQSYLINDFPSPGETVKWVGKENCLIGLQQNTDLQKEITKRVRALDIEAHNQGLTEDTISVVPAELED